MSKTVKVWTTIDKKLKEELASLSKDLGYRSATECMREAIRRGVQILRAQRSISAGFSKRKDSILSTSGLLSEAYERMKTGELERKIRSQW